MFRGWAEKGGARAQAFGRSRGGFTYKVHARCDNQGHPLGFILTGGEASDYGAVDALMAIPVTKSNRRERIPCDFRRYKDRNRIERMFGHLKQFRRVATRYDKTALSFASFLNLAAIRKWLPHFVNAT